MGARLGGEVKDDEGQDSLKLWYCDKMNALWEQAHAGRRGPATEEEKEKEEVDGEQEEGEGAQAELQGVLGRRGSGLSHVLFTSDPCCGFYF